MAEARSHQQDGLQHTEAEAGVNGFSVGLAQTCVDPQRGQHAPRAESAWRAIFLNSEVPPSGGRWMRFRGFRKNRRSAPKVDQRLRPPPVRPSYRSAVRAGE